MSGRRPLTANPRGPPDGLVRILGCRDTSTFASRGTHAFTAHQLGLPTTPPSPVNWSLDPRLATASRAASATPLKPIFSWPRRFLSLG